MTLAVCVKCGSLKHGAFTACGSCGQHPRSEIDLAYSIALTDHYFSREILNKISADMRAGQPRPSLPPDQEERMREAARQYIRLYGETFGLALEKPSDAAVAAIRIHPPRSGRVSDMSIAEGLAAECPTSFRKAQDLLVAAERYVDGPGLFRSRKSLIQNLQREVYELKDSLRNEDYRKDLHATPSQLVFAFLSEFSDAFPNWQREYAELNRFIPACF